MNDLTLFGIGPQLARVAQEAMEVHLRNSAVLKAETDRIILNTMKLHEPAIQAAVANALMTVLADPTVIEPMVRNALQASATHMHGSFDGVMKRVGKDLALDRKTLEKLVEAVKLEISINNEKLGIGLFS